MSDTTPEYHDLIAFLDDLREDFAESADNPAFVDGYDQARHHVREFHINHSGAYDGACDCEDPTDMFVVETKDGWECERCGVMVEPEND